MKGESKSLSTAGDDDFRGERDDNRTRILDRGEMEARFLGELSAEEVSAEEEMRRFLITRRGLAESSSSGSVSPSDPRVKMDFLALAFDGGRLLELGR